ncbi:MAG: GNAT family N-acetyltransferase [Leptolyngbyaceae bacterium]|nr:GNAT family N-acetyltransferase [Leptolyngbyaceae bacterium]
MDLLIRLATREDLPDIIRLYRQSGVDRDSGLTVTDADRFFQRLQQYPNYTLWVATLGELDHKPVGTFALLVMDNLVHQGNPSGVVEGVAVDPSFQGKGIGRQMMEVAIAQCRAAGCYKLALSSHLQRKEAHAFYECLGFEQHGYSFRIDLEA